MGELLLREPTLFARLPNAPTDVAALLKQPVRWLFGGHSLTLAAP